MAELDMSEAISAFHAQRPRLLQDHGPSWVVFVGAEFKGSFKEFDDAATFALDKLGAADFLIRHTEEHIPHIPLVVVEAA
ncbi:hypothetical protein [Terricaulis silvestris]|uniref:Uncharacterized protein n=1 Tax=Terricaulis silvestris TaxID=2686094 RepID=A0A6I6MXJ6_9CAUL|nr:hypothetical protein [Terricaulis silvestris]QGZ96352.1 hypothetical protein DSM104635_03211 [Terricaulis silvestris]